MATLNVPQLFPPGKTPDRGGGVIGAAKVAVIPQEGLGEMRIATLLSVVAAAVAVLMMLIVSPA